MSQKIDPTTPAVPITHTKVYQSFKPPPSVLCWRVTPGNRELVAL